MMNRYEKMVEEDRQGVEWKIAMAWANGLIEEGTKELAETLIGGWTPINQISDVDLAEELANMDRDKMVEYLIHRELDAIESAGSGDRQELINLLTDEDLDASELNCEDIEVLLRKRYQDMEIMEIVNWYEEMEAVMEMVDIMEDVEIAGLEIDNELSTIDDANEFGGEE